MKRSIRGLTVVPVLALSLGALAAPTSAGPEKIRFPEGWKSHVLYTTVDRYDSKQYRELYGTREAVEAMKAGKPLPSGSVLTLVQYKAQVDAAGNPVKDANGRFQKGDLIGFTVMEKRTGWGTEYPAELRNGEWEYAAFGADLKLNEKANYKGCFQCHKPHEKTDFVISQTKLVAAPHGAPARAGDINISGLAFGPGKLTVEAGKSVTWTNADDSPHQIAFVKTQPRSPILAKGQSHAQTFSQAGVHEYTCGLHPGMKGSIEVK